MLSITKNFSSTEYFPFTTWKNVYQPNRKLGDEYRYVFNRKNAKRFIGNTLEKPQLIMKRLKVRDTTFDNEVIRESDAIQGVLAEQNFRVGARMMKTSAKMDYSGGYGAVGQSNMERILCQNNQIYSFQNFLQHATLVHKNLHPDENGKIECEFDSKNYSNVCIIATSNKSSTQVIADVSQASFEIEKRDLSLTDPLDSDKYFNETRNTDLVYNGTDYKINDITSTEYIFIDTISQVKKASDDLFKLKSLGMDETLMFVLKWHTFTQEQKNKKYNDFQCHELNLFLYFKDYEYFTEVARPFVSSKMEKTFIDYWLLHDDDQILHYQSISHFDKLNALEQSLLVFTVLQRDADHALKLANRIKLSSDANGKNESIENKNRIFDTVLALNLLQKDTKKLELIQQIQAEETKFRDLAQDDFDSLYGAGFDDFSYAKSAAPMKHSVNRMMKQSNEMDMMDCFDNRQDEMSREAAEESYRPMKESKMAKKRAPQMARAMNIMPTSSAPRGAFNEEGLIQKRKEAKTHFQELESASEYCETHYYNNTNMRNPTMILHNQFWADFANHIIQTGDTHGFITPSFTAVQSVPELLAMLAILDLPFEEPNHNTSIHGNKGIIVKAASNFIVFKKEIKEAAAELDTNLLSIHRFYEYNNPQSKKKLKEFLTHKIYTCEVVVTNVSTDHQDFQTLWQIPSGALPVSSTTYQKTETKYLNSYSTLTFQFHFYFPKTGEFTQFPTNITMGEKVVATANKCTLNVVDKLTEITFEMFSDYIQSGDINKICEFLQTANLIEGEKGFSFYDILWMLSDKETFNRVIDILRARMIFNSEVWSYGFFHNDKVIIKEYLRRAKLQVSLYGLNAYHDLFDPTGEQKKFRHLDYYPLVNARAHQMSDDVNKGILNREFRETYNRFLFKASSKKQLDTEDWLNWTLYYLLQDRTNEAIHAFANIDASTLKDGGAMKIQFDYLGAYLDFFTGQETNFKVAREVAVKYLKYPVLYWRSLFKEIQEQLQEYDGDLSTDDTINQTDEDKQRENLKKSKNLAPLLECHIDRKDIIIDYTNIAKVDIKYYVIDPELLFSKSPFLAQSFQEFAYVKPLKTVTQELDKEMKSKTVPVDADFASKNLVIEVIGGGKQTFLSYFSTDLKVTINESYGELKVTDKSEKSLSSVYVKVYARHHGGEVKFFRDGYTDIRGKIEYAHSSSGKLGSIEKFAVFVMSDELGSLTKECNPPSNVKK